MNHVFSIIVRNNSGVLSRIAGTFTGRGYNIESIAAGVTEDPNVTRITIVCNGDETGIEYISKLIRNQVDVIDLIDLTDEQYIDREIALIKVQITGATRAEVIQLSEVFRASVVDVGKKMLVLEVTGATEKIDAFEDIMADYGIVESVRTGKIALTRGE